MLVSSVIAIGYVKTSVKRDFAILHSAQQGASSSLSSVSTSQMTDPEGRGLTGGLEIVSDASEQVGW